MRYTLCWPLRLRHLQGLAALSVNWGAWAGSGMAEKAGIERIERQGFAALQPAAGLYLAAFYRALRPCQCMHAENVRMYG